MQDIETIKANKINDVSGISEISEIENSASPSLIWLIEKKIDSNAPNKIKKFEEAIQELENLLKIRDVPLEAFQEYVRLLIKLGETIELGSSTILNNLMSLSSSLEKLYVQALCRAEKEQLSDKIVLLSQWLTDYYFHQLMPPNGPNTAHSKNAYQGLFGRYGQETHTLGHQKTGVHVQWQHTMTIISFAQLGLKHLDPTDTEYRPCFLAHLNKVYAQTLLRVNIEWHEKHLISAHRALLVSYTTEKWEAATQAHEVAFNIWVSLIQELAGYNVESYVQDVYSALNAYYESLDKKLKQLSDLNEFTGQIRDVILTPTFKKLKKILPTIIKFPLSSIPSLFADGKYSLGLQKIQHEALKNLDTEKGVIEAQHTLSKQLKRLLAEMWDDISRVLHLPQLKEQMCLAVLGSLSREDAAPCSDIECILFLKEENPNTYWLASMALQLFECLVASCGESCSVVYPTLKVGFRIDQSPWRMSELCGTPISLAKRFCNPESLTDDLAYSVLFPTPVWGNISLYEDYSTEIKARLLEKSLHQQWALHRLDANRKRCEKIFTFEALSSEPFFSLAKVPLVNLKECYLKWLTYFAMDVGFYYHLPQLHPLGVMEELKKQGFITAAFEQTYITCYSTLIAHRFQGHVNKGYQYDESNVEECLEFKQVCEAIEQVVLSPFITAQRALMKKEEITSLEKLFSPAAIKKEGKEEKNEKTEKTEKTKKEEK